MNYNLNSAINLRGKTWEEAGYADFCTAEEAKRVITIWQSTVFTSEPFMDIPDYEMAIVEYPDGNTPKRQWYTKERWKSAWKMHREYIHNYNS
jgi:hypothetical protein